MLGYSVGGGKQRSVGSVLWEEAGYEHWPDGKEVKRHRQVGCILMEISKGFKHPE